MSRLFTCITRSLYVTFHVEESPESVTWPRRRRTASNLESNERWIEVLKTEACYCCWLWCNRLDCVVSKGNVSVKTPYRSKSSFNVYPPIFVEKISDDEKYSCQCSTREGGAKKDPMWLSFSLKRVSNNWTQHNALLLLKQNSPARNTKHV